MLEYPLGRRKKKQYTEWCGLGTETQESGGTSIPGVLQHFTGNDFNF